MFVCITLCLSASLSLCLYLRQYPHPFSLFCSWPGNCPLLPLIRATPFPDPAFIIYNNFVPFAGLSHCMLLPLYTGVNPGGGGVTTPRFWAGGHGDRRGVVGGRGRVVKHYYILSCTGSIFESGDFKRNRIIILEFSCKWQILSG